MNKEERFIYVSNELQRLYPETPIPLDHDSIYTLLIAVLLSAQCTDIRVNKVTPELFALADNPFDMALVDPEEIRQIINPAVYLQKNLKPSQNLVRFYAKSMKVKYQKVLKP